MSESVDAVLQNADGLSRACSSSHRYSLDYASQMDEMDQLAALKDAFVFPQPAAPIERTIYLCGNSLGLQPKTLKAAVVSQIDKWATEGVEGHFTGAALTIMT